jgi:hypothetical protein
MRNFFDQVFGSGPWIKVFGTSLYSSHWLKSGSSPWIKVFCIKSRDVFLYQVLGSSLWIKSLDQVLGSSPWIKSLDQVFRSSPYIKSLHQVLSLSNPSNLLKSFKSFGSSLWIKSLDLNLDLASALTSSLWILDEFFYQKQILVSSPWLNSFDQVLGSSLSYLHEL